MKNDIIDILNEKLLNASTQNGSELFYSIVDAIQETTNCLMCSLWSINNNDTNGGFQSASLIVRKLENKIEYPTNNSEDFTHDLGDCFIKEVLEITKKTQQPYYSCSITQCKRHRSQKALIQLGLKYFISIPIPNQEKTKNIALLKLSFIEKPAITKDKILLIAKRTRTVLSSCFFRYMLYNKHQIMERLVKNYKKKGSKKNLGDIFHPIIHNILPTHCKYQGASVFIWDSYMNHYKLLVTTGIVGVSNKNDYQKIVYQAGKNKTGAIVDTRKSMIYDNLENVPNNNHKSQEITKDEGKTMMVVPIFRPSKRDEIIGILRFVNKKNSVNINVVDYFNDSDIEIMEYASDYIALIIDYFLGEEERNDFISKLSHEFISPATSIRNSADRLLKNNYSWFIDRYFASYLEDVRDLAELQLQQADTNLHISKIRVNTPRSQKYKEMDRYFLKDIILQGKKTVIPFARIEGIRFDKIEIDTHFPDWSLHIDKGAFRTVFYNLLANAIKYRDPGEDFSVKIMGNTFADWLVVYVSDYGLGIAKEDQDKIFLMGYRGDNVTEYNNDGFGIGLPVVKQIITDFEGEIRVANFHNPTTFEIKLPKKLFGDKYTKEKKWNSVK